MPTALQLGQRQLPLQQILQHLTTSPILSEYLRLVIIEETLIQWQQSPEYQAILLQKDLATDPDLPIAQITTKLPEQPRQIAATNRSLTLEKYQQSQWGHRISSYFLARKGQLDRAIFSAIQVDNLGMAQEIYLRVKDRRQSFDKLARLYSQGAEAKLGGVIGPISIECIHPHIAEYLISLEPGELSPLFQIDNFYVFIKLEQRLPARFDDEMKEQLMEELFDRWLQREVSSRISSLHLTTPPENDESPAQIPLVGDLDKQELRRSAREVQDTNTSILSDSDSPPELPAQTGSASILSSVSFFPPTITEVVEHQNVVTSSFFLPQSTPTQLIDCHQQRRRQVIFQQFVAFWLFFSLFLGGGLGTVYLLNFLTGHPGLQTRQGE
jgi:hypothetical protein